MTPDTRRILTVPRKLLFPTGEVSEFWPANDYYRFQEFVDRHGEWAYRGAAENDKTRKQVIPQIVIRCGDKFLMHQIPTTGGEARLHGRWPLLLGGHIEYADGNDILKTAHKELSEEVPGWTDDAKAAGLVGDLTFLGFVNDETTPVNSVHFGVVFYAEVLPVYEEGLLVRGWGKDDGVHNLYWETPAGIESRFEDLTDWSKSVWRGVFRSQFQPAPSEC
jgi:predicted NUDIX family phosphoesterase